MVQMLLQFLSSNDATVLEPNLCDFSRFVFKGCCDNCWVGASSTSARRVWAFWFSALLLGAAWCLMNHHWRSVAVCSCTKHPRSQCCEKKQLVNLKSQHVKHTESWRNHSLCPVDRLFVVQKSLMMLVVDALNSSFCESEKWNNASDLWAGIPLSVSERVTWLSSGGSTF